MVYYFSNNNQVVKGKYPIPTEIFQKKKDRKIFKKGRKEYYKQMHKTSLDFDWKKSDAEYRREKAILKTEQRQRLSANHQFRSFQSREIQGYWEEKGSNNLSGRIHTSEVDFNNFIRFKFLLELKNLSESTMSYGISSVPGINIISLLSL